MKHTLIHRPLKYEGAIWTHRCVRPSSEKTRPHISENTRLRNFLWLTCRNHHNNKSPTWPITWTPGGSGNHPASNSKVSLCSAVPIADSDNHLPIIDSTWPGTLPPQVCSTLGLGSSVTLGLVVPPAASSPAAFRLRDSLCLLTSFLPLPPVRHLWTPWTRMQPLLYLLQPFYNLVVPRYNYRVLNNLRSEINIGNSDTNRKPCVCQWPTIQRNQDYLANCSYSS